MTSDAFRRRCRRRASPGAASFRQPYQMDKDARSLGYVAAGGGENARSTAWTFSKKMYDLLPKKMATSTSSFVSSVEPHSRRLTGSSHRCPRPAGAIRDYLRVRLGTIERYA